MTTNNHHLRQLESFRFDPMERMPDPFAAFFIAKVLPLLTFKGHKQDAKKDLAARMVHSLIVARKRNRTVADSRDTAHSDTRMRVQVWDAIEKAGFLIKVLGSESSGMVTRYYASGTLMVLRKRWRLEELVPLHLHRNSEHKVPTRHALVYLHTGKIDPVTGEPLAEKDQKVGIPLVGDFRETEDLIEAFNDNVLSFTWKVRLRDPNGKTFTSPLNPCLRQIHCGKRYRAVRFYSWSWLSGQLLSKEQRQNILIDNQPVAELDFSGCQLRMMYHLKDIDPQGDVYRPEQVFKKVYAKASGADRDKLRDFVKRATLIALNVKSETAAHGSLMKWLKNTGDPHWYWDRIACERPRKKLHGILDRLVSAHSECDWIAGKFFTAGGLEMMTVESRIMRVMLQLFTRAKRPALMIHDAVVCRVSDVTFTERVMTWAWRYMLSTPYRPVIKREF